ncbi:MAG: hypothetical protein ACI9FR_001514 [Cryomorphaceae bacterium]|jgi:hypothetical protein
MKKIVGIALASNVLFFSNAMAQTSEPDFEFESSEGRVIEFCKNNAKSLRLDEDAIDN